MAAVRALLTRVTRLEQAKAAPVSPFEVAYGSVDGFAAVVQGMIDAGEMDDLDGPIIIAAIRRFHTDRVWDLWQGAASAQRSWYQRTWQAA